MVSYKMTGKAISCALRAHFLVDGTLMINLLNNHMGCDFDINAVSSLFERVVADRAQTIPLLALILDTSIL